MNAFLVLFWLGKIFAGNSRDLNLTKKIALNRFNFLHMILLELVVFSFQTFITSLTKDYQTRVLYNGL